MASLAQIPRPGTFFITAATRNRRPLFQVPANAELFLEILQHYRREGHYLLHAYVVMPDHVHLILTPRAIPLDQAISLIKGGFVHRLNANIPIWERSFTDHAIRDADDLETRRAHLHQNPVRANLHTSAERYPYSSAYRPN